MIPLSDNTKKLLNAVIAVNERERIVDRIQDQVSENIPYCENSNPQGMERIRFSVLRLLAEGEMKEDDVFGLAYTDWRDLFMAARHGSPGEHKKWAKRAIKQAAQQVAAADTALGSRDRL